MNFFRRFIHLDQAFLFEYNGGGAPGGVADPAVGGGAAPTSGTALQGQGQPPEGSQPAGFRQHFPDVPDEQWALIEPHVGRIEAHTTQLQQQVAPFRALMDAGHTPETLQNLVNFDQRFQSNPLDTWLQLGQMLQQAQGSQPPALDPEVDLEYLAAIARGEDPDVGSAPGVIPGADPATMPQGSPETQQLVALVQNLQAQVQQLEQGVTQERVAAQQQVSDRLFDTRMGQMKDALKGAGWPEDLLAEETLVGTLIAHKGNFSKAAKALIDQRAGILKSFTETRNTTTPSSTAMPNGAPPTTTPPPVSSRDRGDSFKTATRSASARLARLNGSG